MHQVASVEPLQLYKHCQTVTQNVPWGLARVSGYGKLPATGPYTYKYNDAAAGQGVVAYVLDTGINDKHVQFEGRATRGQKFVTDPRPGTVTDDDDHHGHGTHCAGTIGSKDYGVAKKVALVGVKVFNDLPDNDPYAGATNADIIAALEYVVNEYRRHGKPSVVNLSLGGGPSQALDDAVASAVRVGVVVCCAAGNETVRTSEARSGQLIRCDIEMCADSPLWQRDAQEGSPARSPLALTVAASDVNDKIAYFSSFGKREYTIFGHLLYREYHERS